VVFSEGGTPAAEAEGVEFLKYVNDSSVYSLKSGEYKFMGDKKKH